MKRVRRGKAGSINCSLKYSPSPAFVGNHRKELPPGLEAILVSPDIAVEVLLERLVENGGFGMSRAVNSRRFASQNTRIRRGAIAVLDSNFLQKIRLPVLPRHFVISPSESVLLPPLLANLGG